MSKRIFQIAKDMGMATKTLIERIKDLGIDDSVTNALSTLSDDKIRKLKAALADEAPATGEEKSLGAGVVRRRAPRRRSLQTNADKDESDDLQSAAIDDDIDDEVEEETIATDDAQVARRRRIVPGAGDADDSTVVNAPVPEETRDEPQEAAVAGDESVDEPEVEEEQPAPRRRFATVRTRENLDENKAAPVVVETRTTEVVAVVPAAEATQEKEAESEDDAPKKPRRRFATVVTRRTVEQEDPATPTAQKEEKSASKFKTVQTTQVEEPVVEPEPEAPRQRFATIVHKTDSEQVHAKRSPVELAEIARREADEASTPGGAEILGMVDIDIINQRNENRRRGPAPRSAADPRGERAPGPAREKTFSDKGGDTGRKKGKRGKRVVQSGELYGKFDQGRRRKKKKGRSAGQPTQQTTAAEHKRVVRMEEAIVISDLARQMGVKAGEIVMKLAFDLGLRGANINTPVDYATASLVAEQYNHKVEQVGFDMSDYLPKYDDSPENMTKRSPVVTVMGHVDHGKTSLLDAIRTANVSVAQGEAGGITQHIGAYKVSTPQGEICFLDTPGHEAFTALRARGAKATDIVILVVAGDDGVKPQTVEALNHARAAETPVIVAITKMDKPDANAQKVKIGFTEHSLISEDMGGDVVFVEVSSKSKMGIEELLEAVILQAEVMELTANADRKADGLAIESRLDVGRGPIATLLVQGGTLRVGDIVVIGKQHGHVRAMTDEHGRQLETATPSTPVEITGLSGVPASGEHFYVVNEEKDARAIAEHVSQQNKQAELAVSATSAFKAGEDQDIASMLPREDVKELKIIIKADVQGSVEALEHSIRELANEKVSVRIIHSGVGSITESDVNLASSSSGDSRVLICGFNVKPEQRAANLADQNGVKLLTHSIIYDMLDEVKSMMAGLLDPVYEEEVIGHAEVRMVFQNSRVGAVAGCMITDGIIRRGAKARVMRDGVEVYKSSIGSLRHIETDKRELQAGFECGLSVEHYSDFKTGDIVECYLIHERVATLD